MNSPAEPSALVDTSAAVPMVLADHEHHEATFEALADRQLGLAGHAAFESYSVLTRLPHPNRCSPATARHVLAKNFPGTRHPSPDATAELLAALPEAGIAGGAVYDALVALAAREHALPLVTRDRRAVETYHWVGATTELLT